MDFQHDRSWALITDILAAKLTVKEAWRRFIDEHELNTPKPYWIEFKQIDVESEQIDIVNWLDQIVSDEPVPSDIVAFWIGILKFAGENGEGIPTIYFSGADNYNKDDIDWACDPSYLPANRYAQPGVLQQIDNIARTDEVNYEFLDWILPIAYCAFTFDEIVRIKLKKDLLLKYQDKYFISVGYDSGDYLDLTPIQN